MRQTAKKATDHSPKTYQETAVENYQKIADSADQGKAENVVDVLA